MGRYPDGWIELNNCVDTWAEGELPLPYLKKVKKKTWINSKMVTISIV